MGGKEGEFLWDVNRTQIAVGMSLGTLHFGGGGGGGGGGLLLRLDYNINSEAEALMGC